MARPLMVTVAKSLDVPIKLMFPRPASPDDPSGPPTHAMLGLGDIVLPGIMIGLALRFDLYLFYLRRQKRLPAVAEGEADTVQKPQYHSLAGRWSDHFWTHSLMGRPLWVASKADEGKPEAPFTFPKTYFTASLVGYVLGLLATLGVMMVWNHAQPALLYLVPGVLCSVWLTALVRGELDLMWNYTEDIGGEDKSEKKQDDKTEPTTGKKQTKGALPDQSSEDESTHDGSKRTKHVASHRPEREVFSFSIEAPWKSKQAQSAQKGTRESNGSPRDHSEKHNWAPSKKAGQIADTEPPGKRVRLN
jgi:minor histocompatibility antigen H13